MPLPVLPDVRFAKLITWRPALVGQATFTSGIDVATQTVRVTGGGVWTAADADRYFDQQSKIVDEARREFGHLRVFYDLRDWVVDSPAGVDPFTKMNNEIYRPEDRIVATADNFLNKKYSRAAMGTGLREVFVSRESAEKWLQAYIYSVGTP